MWRWFVWAPRSVCSRDTAGQERFRTITTAYYRGAMVGANRWFRDWGHDKPSWVGQVSWVWRGTLTADPLPAWWCAVLLLSQLCSCSIGCWSCAGMMQDFGKTALSMFRSINTCPAHLISLPLTGNQLLKIATVELLFSAMDKPLTPAETIFLLLYL